ncbi:MAG: glycosyltransferase [Kiloniellales bacterium]
MTRLMQVIAGRRHGGAEAFFERLTLAFVRAGVAQQVLIRRDAERARRLSTGGVEPGELRFGGRLDLATGRRLARHITEFQPDVVLAWMSRAARFCPPPRAGDGYLLVARLGGYYDLKYYRHCDHLIGDTRDIVTHLTDQGWPTERAHYLPNFADSTPAPPVPRADLDTPAEAPLLLALGRLHVNKGFDVLIDALALLPRAFLWLAGEGPLRAELEAQAQHLGIAGRVRFLGWRTDVGALMAAADIVVCPSRAEPFGNVVIEAWAHRRPVVAAQSAGPAALITPDASGLLVPIDDPPALAAALGRLIEDRTLGARLAEGGHAAYLAEFTEQAVVGGYLDLFRRLTARESEQIHH